MKRFIFTALVLVLLAAGGVFAQVQEHKLNVTDEMTCSYRKGGSLTEGNNWANMRILVWPVFIHLTDEYARELFPSAVSQTWLVYDARYDNMSTFIDWSRVTERYARDYYGWERSTGYDPYWIHEVNTSEGWVLESNEFYIPEITFVTFMMEERRALNPVLYCYPSFVEFEWIEGL